MSKLFNVLTIAFILFAAQTSLLAQSKVEVKYTRPLLGKLGVGDMWNLMLNNTTASDIKIYLTGSVTEEKDGLIIEGKTKVFTLKPGKTNYKYNDFSSAEIKYNNGKYKEIMLRTGAAPEGDYTICISAFDEGGAEVGREDCMTQSVRQTESITLLTPVDGEEIDPEQPVLFTWTSIPNADQYKLRIVEMRSGQSPEIAIRQNIPIFEKDNIKTASYQGDPIHGVDVKLGTKFAWQVTYGDAKSEISSMLVMKSGEVTHELSEGVDTLYILKPNGEYIDPLSGDDKAELIFSWHKKKRSRRISSWDTLGMVQNNDTINEQGLFFGLHKKKRSRKTSSWDTLGISNTENNETEVEEFVVGWHNKIKSPLVKPNDVDLLFSWHKKRPSRRTSSWDTLGLSNTASNETELDDLMITRHKRKRSPVIRNWDTLAIYHSNDINELTIRLSDIDGEYQSIHTPEKSESIIHTYTKSSAIDILQYKDQSGNAILVYETENVDLKKFRYHDRITSGDESHHSPRSNELSTYTDKDKNEILVRYSYSDKILKLEFLSQSPETNTEFSLKNDFMFDEEISEQMGFQFLALSKGTYKIDYSKNKFGTVNLNATTDYKEYTLDGQSFMILECRSNPELEKLKVVHQKGRSGCTHTTAISKHSSHTMHERGVSKIHDTRKTKEAPLSLQSLGIEDLEFTLVYTDGENQDMIAKHKKRKTKKTIADCPHW